MTDFAIVVIGAVAVIVFAIIPFVVIPLVVPGRWSMFTTTSYLTKDLGKIYREAYLKAMEEHDN